MSKPISIPYISRNLAIKQANEKVWRGIHAPVKGLLSRWDVINERMGGCFRFGEVTYICGASGSGKSYFLNMLREDFISPINKEFKVPFKILSFSFEMKAEDEMIRTFGDLLGLSYSDLISAYETLPEREYKLLQEIIPGITNDKVYFVEHSGDRDQIWGTVEKFNTEFPGEQLIITFDHILLADYLDETSEVDLVSRMSRLAMDLKKSFGAMVIMLGQLNDKIEQDERITNNYRHYPTKTDIHGSKSVYMAADTVLVAHRPERLGITRYGPRNYDAKDLLAFHFLKGRLTGKEGIVLMKQDFDHSKIVKYGTNTA